MRSPIFPKVGEEIIAETPAIETIKPLTNNTFSVSPLKDRIYSVKIGLILVIPNCKIHVVTNKPINTET